MKCCVSAVSGKRGRALSQKYNLNHFLQVNFKGVLSSTQDKAASKSSLLYSLSNYILIPVYLIEQLNEIILFDREKYCKYNSKINYHLINPNHGFDFSKAMLTTLSHKKAYSKTSKKYKLSLWL